MIFWKKKVFTFHLSSILSKVLLLIQEKIDSKTCKVLVLIDTHELGRPYPDSKDFDREKNCIFHVNYPRSCTFDASRLNFEGIKL